MLKSALLVAASIVVGAGAVQLLHAAGSPPVYLIAMVDVKDQDGYAKDFLPKAVPIIKDSGGEYIAGGMNKTTSTNATGMQPPNRVVILKWPNAEAFKKFQELGGTKVREEVGTKYGEWKAEWLVEGVEQK
jgi:uncharacterized protein (DUF1330 family)